MRHALSQALYYHAALKKWKERSVERQKRYSERCKGKEYHSFDCSSDEGRTRLLEMVFLAVYGSPMDGEAMNPFAPCNSAQQSDAAEYVDIICARYEKKEKATVELITLMICCKSIVGESTVPVFRIRLGEKKIVFMDTSKIVYDEWTDWLKNNKLPAMKCFPRNGSYVDLDGEQSGNNESPFDFSNVPPSPDISSRRAMSELSKTWFFFNGSEMLQESASLWQYVLEYKASMRNEISRSTLDRFLCQKDGSCSMEDLKKKIKFMSTIKNPDYLFGGLSAADNIEIDHRTLETLLISVNATENIPTAVPVNQITFIPPCHSAHPYYKMSMLLREHESFTTNKLKFDNMASHEAYKLQQALYAICGRDLTIIKAAVEISKELNVDNITDFRAVAELVVLYKPPATEDPEPEIADTVALEEPSSVVDLMQQGEEEKEVKYRCINEKVEYLMSNADERNKFVAKIMENRKKSRKLAKEGDFVFESDLAATYHFTKHSEEDFGTDSMQEYLNDIPRKFFIPGNLRGIKIEADRITETYCASNAAGEDKDTFGMLLRVAAPPAVPTKKNPVAKKHKPLLLTLYKGDYLANYEKKRVEVNADCTFIAPSYSIVEPYMS